MDTECSDDLKDRVAYVEKVLGEWVDTTGKALKGIEAVHEQDDLSRAAMVERVVFIENLVGELTKDIEAAHVAVSQCATVEVTTALEQRLIDMEAAHVAALQRAPAEISTTLERRLNGMEMQLTDLSEKTKQATEFADAVCGSLKVLDTKMPTFDSLKQEIDNEIKNLEALLHDKVEAIARTNQAHIGNIEALFEHLMNLLQVTTTSEKGDLPAVLSTINSDMDLRVQALQEEQKLAQEQLKSEHSLREAQQARIMEQWENDNQNRKLYQEGFMDLLAQERCTREAEFQKFEEKISAFEKVLSNHGRPSNIPEQQQIRLVASRAQSPVPLAGNSAAAPSVPPPSAAAPSVPPRIVPRSSVLVAACSEPPRSSAARIVTPMSPSISSRPSSRATSPHHRSQEQPATPSAPRSVVQRPASPSTTFFVSMPNGATAPMLDRRMLTPQRALAPGLAVPPAHEKVLSASAGRGRPGSPISRVIQSPQEFGMMKKTAATVKAQRDEISSASTELEKAIAAVATKRSQLRSLSVELCREGVHSQKNSGLSAEVQDKTNLRSKPDSKTMVVTEKVPRREGSPKKAAKIGSPK